MGLRSELLAHEIGVKVYGLVLKPGESVDTSLSLQQVGLDPLMATELRRWSRKLLGLQISALETMGTGSLIQLTELTSTALRNKYASALVERYVNRYRLNTMFCFSDSTSEHQSKSSG